MGTGTQVVSVEPGGPAGAGALGVGDRVMAVDGVPSSGMTSTQFQGLLAGLFRHACIRVLRLCVPVCLYAVDVG